MLATTLFCIPHAGGNAAYYTGFGCSFPPSVKVMPLELPGRGRRMREPLLTDLDAMSRDLFARMQPTAQTVPYAIFGHSMGGLLAFLCARLAQSQALPLPRALFISSSAAPDCARTRLSRTLSQLPHGALWDHVVAMGGIPPCLSASPDFCRYIEPVLRADFMALETWIPAPCPPLPLPIHVCLGSADIVTRAEAAHWEALSDKSCTVHTFSGGHFYLQDNWRELASRLAQALHQAA